MNKKIPRCANSGSVLLLTLVMVTLLALQVTMISLIAVRGFGEEGMLLTQNTTAREAGNTALSRLQDALHLYLQTSDAASAETAFARGGTNDIDSEILMADNPDGGGSEAMPVTISAWVQERRGHMYHLVGRAVVGGVDMVTHRWVYVKPCVSGTTLLTLATGQTGPGYNYSIGISPFGEVFWGDNVTSTGKFYSWSKANGLSVILSNRSRVGQNSYRMNQYQNPSTMAFFANGRVFFGHKGDAYSSYWTYKSGLLTVVGSGYNPLGGSIMNAAGTEVYYSTNDNKGARWNESTGKQDIAVNNGTPNWCHPGDSGSMGIDGTGRVYFGCAPAPMAYTWNASKGTSVISSTMGPAPGFRNSMVGSPVEERVYIGTQDQASGTSYFYTWTPAGGLVNLLTTTDGGLGHNGTVVANDGRVFWTSLYRSNGRVWSWKNGVGLTTIFSATGESTYYELEIVKGGSEDGRLYAIGTENSSVRVRTWSAADGLSTIRTGHNASTTNYNHIMDVAPDGRVYFGEDNNTNEAARGLWTWAKSTGLSLILGNRKRTGPGCVRAVPATNGVVFCDRDTAASDNNVYYWDPSSKSLITLLTGPGQPGYHSMAVSPDGASVAIGNAVTGNVYLWTQGEKECDP